MVSDKIKWLTKSSRLDGMHTVFRLNFLEYNWKIDFNVIRAFFHHVLKELNDTRIVLIPKRENPTKLNNYRHISYVMSYINSF